MKEHKISLSTAILLTMNIMIGSGILIGPGYIAAVAGNASFLAWPIVALLFLPMVLCTAQLSRMFPNGGGFYTYAKAGLNQTAGFFSGWLYILGYTFALGVEVMALREIFMSTVSETHWFFSNAMLFNIVCILFFIGLNLISFKLFSRILNSLTITKILPLVILIALLPFVFNTNFTVTSSEISMLPMALPFAIFGFFGFEYCSSIAPYIENSERNAARAVVIGFLATAVLYMLFHFGLLNVMGATNLANNGASDFASFLQVPIPFLKSFLMFLIPLASILTIIAGGNGMLNSNAVLMHAMAQENLFWNSSLLTYVNRYGRPWVILLFQGLVIFALITLMPNINLINNLCNLGIVAGFLLPFVSLFIIQRQRRLYRGMPLTILAIAITIGFCGYSFYRMGATTGERFYYMIPMFIMLTLGYLFYTMRGREAKQNLFYH